MKNQDRFPKYITVKYYAEFDTDHQNMKYSITETIANPDQETRFYESLNHLANITLSITN